MRNNVNSIFLFLFHSNSFFRFNLQLQEWGVDTTKLKEPAITWRIIGWTKEWEKELHQKNTAMVKAVITNKYKNTVFNHPDCDNKTVYVSNEDIVFIPQKKDGEWTIFAVCDEDNVEDESLTPFLAISLICEKQQSEGVIVKMPEPGSAEEKVWGADNN